MHLLIGTPTYNGNVTGNYMRSVLGLFQDIGHQSQWMTTKATLLVDARNYFASVVLAGDFTHLLFVDADVDFDARVVARMLAFDRPVVGAAYPHRELNLRALHAAARQFDSPNIAMTAALTFPVELEEPRVSRGDFHRAIVAPTGLMLIKREVFEAMRDTFPELYCNTEDSYFATKGLARVLQCFEQLRNPHGVMLSEDVSFCRRWRGMGGEIWLTFDESIGHTGPYTFRAALSG
jgi:hypothetical protein